MKRIKLRLTGVADVITEAAKKKLKSTDIYQVPTCKNGLTEEQYIDLGVKLPEDLIAKIKQQEEGIPLEDGDFEETYSAISIFDDKILFKVANLGETVLFVKGGYTLTVLETIDDIDDFVEYMSRNWLEKIKDYFLFIFHRKINNKYKQIN